MEKNLTKIATALTAFRIKASKITKDATNPYFNSKYASLSNILDAIQIPLEETGLTFIQTCEGDVLKTILVHESGEQIEASMPIHLVANTPQAMGSAITYARRYSLTVVLGLNIDEDDDGNTATAAVVKPAQVAPSTERPADNRPWLTEAQFNQALVRIREGEPDLFKQVTSAFKMKKDYRELLTKAFNNISQINN